MLYTPFTTALGLRVPLVSAPFSVATPAMVAAVSNAGALGLYSVTWRTPDAIRARLTDIQERTPHPFGVNLVLEWDMRERLQVCLEAGVRVVSLWWGNPEPYIDMAHEAGAKVLFTVGSVAEAERAVRAGADVIVAQGWEAGGHVRGQMTTFTLLPQVVDAVDVPVIAAGGIGDGRGLAAALMLGASGAWIGTRFLMAAEAAVHDDYREQLRRAQGDDTTHTWLFNEGWQGPHRVLRNSTVEAWQNAGEPPVGQRPDEGETIAWTAAGEPLNRYDFNSPAANMIGNLEAMALYAGQSVGLISSEQRAQPAGEIVADLLGETRRALNRAVHLLP